MHVPMDFPVPGRRAAAWQLVRARRGRSQTGSQARHRAACESRQSKATAPAKKPKPVDINSATAEQLTKVPGVDEALAAKIVQNRPYPTRAYLVTKGVYSQDDYYKVKDYFVAVPPADPKAKK